MATFGKTAAIRSISAKNYRSFREVEFAPGHLTALVGANAAGKSSLLDIFRFFSDSLTYSLYTALERRGGLRAVRHTSPGGRPRNVALGAELAFENDVTASYGMKVNARAGGTYNVAEEDCRVWDLEGEVSRLTLKAGRVVHKPDLFFGGPDQEVAALDDTALGLPIYGGLPPYAGPLETLRGLRTYSIVPDKLRELQEPDEGHQLAWDGSNAASVLRHLEDEDREELIEMLAHVVPGVVAVRSATRGNKLTLQFTQTSQGGNNRFEAHQMSDGTLRLLGLLLALYQREHPAFMAIEEPEATIHVAALQALIEVFRARSEKTQIVLTTHSAEIIDALEMESIYLVVAEDGYSKVSPASEASRQAVREALFTPGDLLRSGALRADA